MFKINFKTSPFTVNLKKQQLWLCLKSEQEYACICVLMHRMRAGHISVSRLCILDLSKVFSVSVFISYQEFKKSLFEGFWFFLQTLSVNLLERLWITENMLYFFHNIFQIRGEKKSKFFNGLTTWFFFTNKWWTGMGCGPRFPLLPLLPCSFLSTEKLTMLQWPTNIS